MGCVRRMTVAGKEARRNRRRKRGRRKRLGVLARAKKCEQREWGGKDWSRETKESYTENISLLEKFSMPLSASIVIYARDEGGYNTGFRLRRSSSSSPLSPSSCDPSGDGPRDRLQRDHKGSPESAVHTKQKRRAPLFDFPRQDARSLLATWLGLRNLAPHLSAIIQFPGGPSSREDEDDDDDGESDVVSFHHSAAPAKIVIRAGSDECTRSY